MCARSNGGDSKRIHLGFGGVTAAIGDHIVHFFRGTDQRFDVLGPYIAEGILGGHLCVLYSNLEDADQLCEWLTSKGLDAAGACLARQLILHPGDVTGDAMLTLTARIQAESLNVGHEFVRSSGDGGCALAGRTSLCEMRRWEALLDNALKDRKILALCQFDLTQFGGDVAICAS